MRYALFGLAAGIAALAGVYAAQLMASSGPAQPASPAAMAAAKAGASGAMAKLAVHAESRPLPDAPFQDADGAETRFTDFPGEIVLVNFWATWCAPCLREMPSIDRLAETFKGRPFRVVAISLDRGGPAKPAAFLKRIEARNLALYREPSFEIARQLGITGLPATLILDRSGREVGRLLGHAEWDAPEAQAIIGALLDD